MFISADGGRFQIYCSGTSDGVNHQRFLALMVGASGSTAPTPPRGPPSMFLSVDGGRSQISSSGTSHGPPSMFLSVDGGRQIFSSDTS
jgi:hypothetical protein